ncbi:flavin reductase [Micromonospora sp. WMMD998]|uniref:flavin reductase n=1 Tax=Micromonospora sp. WMMD998 TaxID=3016092 RepID=UPI00249A3197|nr:flavin reductase [Micromonospora sp. WMMD998]WFE40752.1 flavin reductase [Micromonospora sp. WMMD998]
MQRHAPLKPFWICTACAHPWPCGEARAELAADYTGEARWLAVDMAGLLTEATADLTRLYPNPPDPEALHGRFLGWVRRLAATRRQPFRDLGSGWPL